MLFATPMSPTRSYPVETELVSRNAERQRSMRALGGSFSNGGARTLRRGSA